MIFNKFRWLLGATSAMRLLIRLDFFYLTFIPKIFWALNYVPIGNTHLMSLIYEFISWMKRSFYFQLQKAI